MERLSINEVIEHCKRNTERMESHSGRSQLEETPVGNSNIMKQYWEHRQVAEWLEQLKSYKDLEEQGLLLRLPKDFKKWCEKIGDYVYLIDGGDITPMIVINIGFNWDMEFSMLMCGDPECEFSESFEMTCGLDTFNKTVFLTKKEAEQALARMGGRA